MPALKLIPHLLSWALIVLVLVRGFSGQRMIVVTAGNAGFILGAAGALFLSGAVPGSLLFGIIKSALGVSFLLLWGIAVGAIYRSTGRRVTMFTMERFVSTPLCAGIVALLAGLVAGAVPACRLPGTGSPLLFLVLLVLAAVALSLAARLLDTRLPDSFAISPSGMAAVLVALLLFSASSILRLDLFSPLSMKVMKGIHDFVHQFMESILTPDHLFVRPIVWKLIGLLFGKGVGFWGGMVIWFTPAVLVALAVHFQRLPSVAHIRQGAQRRKLLAAALGERRSRLIAPLASVAILGAAAYQSSFPTVEYWDPKPIPVTASQSGEIFIPKKGEIDLADGKLHKYLFKQGGHNVRFFVLLSPAGQLTVDLDACAICKPDGYGQAEGSVICYYCKTLIPLDTVGKPGGCNPVPVRFTERADGVAIDAMTLVNGWTATVRATAGVKEGGS
jgi:hypothetical protein